MTTSAIEARPNPGGASIDDDGWFAVYACGSRVVTSTDQPQYVDVDSMAFTPLPGAVPQYSVDFKCPVVSADGATAAYPHSSGEVRSIDLGSGDTTKIANAGAPIAFSTDGTEVLIDSGDFYVVAADGSGGDVASVQPANGLSAWCALGTTGKLLITTDDNTVLYDVGNDSASDVGGELGSSCSMTPDERYAISSNVVVELATGATWELPVADRWGNVTGNELAFPVFFLEGSEFYYTVREHF